MIRLFKKQRKGNSEVKDKVAQSVATWLLRIQRGWARWMNRQSDRCNPKLRGAILIIFLVLMANISIHMILGSFKTKYKIIAETEAIRMPTVNQSGQKRVTARLPDAALQRIQKFQLYLDSLSKTEGGKIELDRINRMRPGLRDSIKMVELIYKQQ